MIEPERETVAMYRRECSSPSALFGAPKVKASWLLGAGHTETSVL